MLLPSDLYLSNLCNSKGFVLLLRDILVKWISSAVAIRRGLKFIYNPEIDVSHIQTDFKIMSGTTFATMANRIVR